MTYPEEHTALRDILAQCQNPCLVELGAHDGGDTEWMLQYMKDGKAVCVEADPGNFAVLEAKHLPAVTYVFGAITDREGECDFWHSSSNGGGFGSIYQPRDGCGVPVNEFQKIGPVPCFTLDSLYQRLELATIDLLYVDIHGAERDMIVFGRQALAHTKYLFMEVLNHEAYQGMTLRSDLVALLGPDWSIMREFPWNVLLRNNAAI